MRPAPLTLALALVTLAGCRDFAPIEATGRCGDGVLEAEVGEDCDTYAIGDGTACGAPGTPQACRYTCADATCPADWRCGVDQICRAPSNILQPAGPLAFTGRRVIPGDVDGDGLDDLVIIDNTTITTAFGDSEGRFTRTVSIPVGVHEDQVYARDITGDGRLDVLIPNLEGVRIYRGEIRRLDPVALPVARLTDLPGEARIVGGRFGNGSDLGALVVVNDGVRPRAVVVGAEQTDDDALAPLAGSPGPPSITPLPGDGGLYALHTVGSRALLIIRPTCTGATCTLEAVQQLDAPAGLTLSDPAAIAQDIDGDGLVDLLLNYNRPISHIGIARGLGGDRFAAPTGDRWPLMRGPGCRTCDRAGFTTSADAIGDGQVDFAGPGGIYRTVALDPLRVDLLPLELRGHLRTAQFTDLNRDGLLDLVAVRTGDQIDLLLNDGVGFHAHFADVDGAADLFTLDDYDGDLYPDIAVIENSARLVVFFADPLGIPRERIVMLDAADLVDAAPSHGRTSEAAGLWVLRGTETPGEWLVVDFGGSTTRRMSAPLVPSGSVHISLPIRRGGEDRIFLAARQPGGEWPFELADLGAEVGAHIPRIDALESDCRIDQDYSLDAVAADLDGDGDDEIVLTSGAGPGFTDRGDPWPVRVLHLADGRCTPFDLDPDEHPPSDPHLADLDGDGALDLAVVTQPVTNPDRRVDTPAGTPPRLVVWWGDGRGGFDPTPLRRDGITHATPFTLGRTGPAHLAAVVGDEIQLLSLRDRALALAAPPTPIGPAGGLVRGLHPVDVEGDGLDDLVVQLDDLLLFRHPPCDAATRSADLCRRREP